jgi:general L-amino acid transport system substrate-binding protein
MTNRFIRSLLGSVLMTLVLLPAAVPAGAEQNLTAQIRNRGELRCGVSKNIAGFAEQDASGAWRGFEVDYCRALAAAVIGDAGAVKFVPLAASARFPSLRLAQIDVLLASTSWTLSREALLGVRFAAVLFHDGQSFMVPTHSAAQAPRDLRNSEVCVEKDTLHGTRLRAYAARPDTTLRIREGGSATEAAADFFAGRCAALSAEAAQLAALRLRAGAATADYRTLPETLSREALSVVVRGGDPAWETVTRWVAHALILGEEFGIDARGADKAGALGGFEELSERIGMPPGEEFALVARTLGLEPGWLLRAIAASGNYAEVFDRNFGSGSPLGLERGPNRLWNQGGLLFVPPLR